MKKVFNLAVLFTALMATATFTSCSKDENAKVTITLSPVSSSSIAGTITSDNKLSLVELSKDGTVVNSSDSFSEGYVVKQEDGSYVFGYAGLTAGDYSLTATDKKDLTDTKEFTIFNAALGGSLSTAGSFLSIVDGVAYTTAQVNAGSAANVEIIFDGTSFKSAAESVNNLVKANGKTATITAIDTENFSFSTSDGYEGVITVTSGSLSGNDATISVSVLKIVK